MRSVPLPAWRTLTAQVWGDQYMFAALASTRSARMRAWRNSPARGIQNAVSKSGFGSIPTASTRITAVCATVRYLTIS
jgi:hypothetical protein